MGSRLSPISLRVACVIGVNDLAAVSNTAPRGRQRPILANHAAFGRGALAGGVESRVGVGPSVPGDAALWCWDNCSSFHWERGCSSLWSNSNPTVLETDNCSTRPASTGLSETDRGDACVCGVAGHRALVWL